MARVAGLAVQAMITIWHRLNRFLARLRPHREPLSLLIDSTVVALAWNITYLFRLGFERWLSARPGLKCWALRRRQPRRQALPLQLNW